MPVNNFICKYNVRYHKKGSVFRLIGDDLTSNHYQSYFDPVSEESFLNGTFSRYDYGLGKYFKYLGGDRNLDYEDKDNHFYLVKRDIIIFKFIDHYSLNNDYQYGNEGDDEDFEIDGYPLYNIFRDIKHMNILYNFGSMGYSEMYIKCIISQNWTSCYMGDWDCYTEYIGILNDKIDITQLITDESLKLLGERRKIDLDCDSYSGYEEFSKRWTSMFDPNKFKSGVINI